MTVLKTYLNEPFIHLVYEIIENGNDLKNNLQATNNAKILHTDIIAIAITVIQFAINRLYEFL